MKRFESRLGAATVALAIAAMTASHARADAYAYGHATATADGVEEDNFDDATMLTFAHDSEAVHNANGAATPDAFAFARSYGDAYGASGVYVGFGGTGANAPAEGWGRVEGSASSASVSEYRVESDTLAPGTPVTIEMTFHYEGSVSLQRDAARALDGGAFNAWIFADNQVGQNGETMDIEYWGGIDLFGDGEAYDSGDWEGRSLIVDDGNGLITASIDVTDTISYATTVGSTIAFSPNLFAEGYLGTPGDGAAATVDFFDGSTYAFAPAAGQDFRIAAIAVPEPASLAALALGAGALASRRRRR